MKRHLSLLGIALLLTSYIIPAHAREKDLTTDRRLLDSGWTFRLGEGGTDDSQWRPVGLPHDWSVEGDFDEQAPAGNDGGYLPTGIGHYRRQLKYSGREKHLRLYFEGVYMDSEVRVNGTKVGGHPYGFMPFATADIVPYLRKGSKNLIEVRVDNSRQKNCRWYTGSGIYRHVWLEAYDDVHLCTHGIAVTTAGHQANASIAIGNAAQTPRRATVRMTLGGETESQEVSLAAGATDTVCLSVTNTDILLWSPDTPVLYPLQVELLCDGRVTERRTIKVGFRQMEYTPDRGFLLNDRKMLINGACLHHDNGPLGAAALDAAEVRRVRLMKEAGFNAVRTSHNPPSEAFLAACDSLGLMVIDEAFDGWRSEKNRHDYHELFDQWSEADLRTMILRDRNHPSVIAWSIGNEIIERKSPEAVRDAHRLAAVCHALDPTRPVTQALAAWDSDWEIYDPLAAEHDVVGYNYMIHKHEGDHQRVPRRVMWQTESYPRDLVKNWKTVRDYPYVIGDFVWTGLDYIGESGIGRYFYEGQTPGEHYQRDQWPYHGAYCGDVDITGWRKPVSHHRSMLWNERNTEKIYMAVQEPDGYQGQIRETLWSVWPTWESWTWPGWEGKKIEVEVVTRYPQIRLYLNDEWVGEGRADADNGYRFVFALPYRPGTLKAVGLNKYGQAMAATELVTAGEPAAIRAKADRTLLRPDGQDLAFVELEVVDKEGHPCPDATNELKVEVLGNARLEALCNADWRDLGSMRDNRHRAWKGRAMAIVRTGEKQGKALLNVSSPNLTGARQEFIILRDN